MTSSFSSIALCFVNAFTPLQTKSEEPDKIKHRKNCECCPRHSLFKGHNVNVDIVVLNCQKCNQCLKCQVSGHKSLGLLFEGHVMSPHHSINLIRSLVLIIIIVLIVLIIIIVPVVIVVLIQ